MDEEKLNKEIEEFMGKNLPEAPLSVHIDAYYKGFHAGITIRKEDNSSIPVERIKNLIEELISKGFEPSWNPDTSEHHLNGKKEKRTKACVYCGADAVLKSGVKNGRRWAGWFCIENKNHVDWVDTVKK